MHLFWKPWDGSEPPELLAEMAVPPQPQSWTPDGSVLLFTQLDGSSFGIWEFPFAGDDRTPRPLLDTPFNEFHPSLSPNGRWLAYVSDEGGQDEVWVRAYPGPGPVRQVSVGGGWEPVWAPDGRIFFCANRGGTENIWSVLPIIVNDRKPHAPASVEANRPATIPAGNQRLAGH